MHGVGVPARWALRNILTYWKTTSQISITWGSPPSVRSMVTCDPAGEGNARPATKWPQWHRRGEDWHEGWRRCVKGRGPRAALCMAVTSKQEKQEVEWLPPA